MDADVAKEFAELRRLAALAVSVQVGPVRGAGEKTPGEQVQPQIDSLKASIDRLTAAVSQLQSGGGGTVNVKAIAEQLTVVPKD